jgi:hypothetical protein
MQAENYVVPYVYSLRALSGSLATARHSIGSTKVAVQVGREFNFFERALASLGWASVAESKAKGLIAIGKRC